ncbi:MAG: hypothetical protein ACPGO5_00035 [Patescibacteria group bacterium]
MKKVYLNYAMRCALHDATVVAIDLMEEVGIKKPIPVLMSIRESKPMCGSDLRVKCHFQGGPTVSVYMTDNADADFQSFGFTEDWLTAHVNANWGDQRFSYSSDEVRALSKV